MGPLLSASEGCVVELRISNSAWRPSTANSEKAWACSLLSTVDSAEDGSGSSGCGIRASVADMARLSGDDGTKLGALGLLNTGSAAVRYPTSTLSTN